MKKIFEFSAVLAALALSACTTYRPVSSGDGHVGTKRGEATAGFILSVIPTNGDNSMLAAAQDGGIQKIATVDQKITTYLGFYTKVTTIVTGD